MCTDYARTNVSSDTPSWKLRVEDRSKAARARGSSEDEDPDQPGAVGWAGEPKWDGFRALVHTGAGPVVPRRCGTEMASAFPDIAGAAVQLPDATALDGELVVWEDDRLAFERLQNRLQRRGAAAAQGRRRVAGALRRVRPAPAVRDGHDALALPAAPGRTGVDVHHTATDRPLDAAPSTTNPDTVREWLTWTSVGVEGVVFKFRAPWFRSGVVRHDPAELEAVAVRLPGREARGVPEGHHGGVRRRSRCRSSLGGHRTGSADRAVGCGGGDVPRTAACQRAALP